MMQVFDTPEKIKFFALCTLKARLQIEVKTGLKGRGSVIEIARNYGFNGRSKQAALTWVQSEINNLKKEMGVTV